MRKSLKQKARLIVTVESDKASRRLRTLSVYNTQTESYWTAGHIAARGIVDFMDLADLKETLNWNLNGDESLYQFQWAGPSGPTKSTGIAYIF